MKKSKIEELADFVLEHSDYVTPGMLSSLGWCVQHEEEIQKMMGLVPCSIEEHYNLEKRFLMEGQTSLFYVMQYMDAYGKTEAEMIEEKKNIERYVKKSPKEERPFDYDLQLEAEKESFIQWCDDYDCAAFVRSNQDDELIRLNFIALVIGYMRFGAYICSIVQPESYERQKHDIVEQRKMESKWIQDFIDKQPEGPRKEELKEQVKLNWPRLEEARANYRL